MSEKYYEELAKAIKEKMKQRIMSIATMDSEQSCTIDTLKLEEEDLIIPEHFKNGYFKEIELDHNLQAMKNSKTYIKPISAGDRVLLCKISQQKYVIIGRL